jgi:hypothetical protein
VLLSISCLSALRCSRVIEATSSGSSEAETFSTASFGRPWTREIQASARYAVRVVRADPGQVGSDDLVRVLLELASQLVTERFAASLRLCSSNLRAAAGNPQGRGLHAARGVPPPRALASGREI